MKKLFEILQGKKSKEQEQKQEQEREKALATAYQEKKPALLYQLQRDGARKFAETHHNDDILTRISQDKDFFEQAIKFSPGIVRYMSNTLKEDGDFILNLLKINLAAEDKSKINTHGIMGFISLTLLENPEFMLQAVKLDASILQHINNRYMPIKDNLSNTDVDLYKDILKDPKICEAAITQKPELLVYVRNKTFVLERLQKDPALEGKDASEYINTAFINNDQIKEFIKDGKIHNPSLVVDKKVVSSLIVESKRMKKKKNGDDSPKSPMSPHN